MFFFFEQFTVLIKSKYHQVNNGINFIIRLYPHVLVLFILYYLIYSCTLLSFYFTTLYCMSRILVSFVSINFNIIIIIIQKWAIFHHLLSTTEPLVYGSLATEELLLHHSKLQLLIKISVSNACILYAKLKTETTC